MSQLPLGTKAFSKLLGQIAPYTGSINAEVLDLNRTYCKVQLKDRRFVRNHLKSVHAAALMNFAEMSSGLIINYNLTNEYHGILIGFEIEYLKKARGTLISECLLKEVDFTKKQELKILSEIKNTDGVVVARAHAKWLIGPKKGKVEKSNPVKEHS